MWFGDERRHVQREEGFGGTIVEHDEVLRRGGRINRNVHDGTGPADVIVA